MKSFDLDKFTKVMKMTTSPFDPEALSAVRLANQMLLEAEMTWDQVLSARTKKTTESQQARKENQSSDIKVDPDEMRAWLFEFAERMDREFDDPSARVVIHRLKVNKGLTMSMIMRIEGYIRNYGTHKDAMMWQAFRTRRGF